MAGEEWHNYRERRNFLHRGLTSYYNNSTSSTSDNNSNYLNGQSHLNYTEPIHRRRQSLILDSPSHGREHTYHQSRDFYRPSASPGLQPYTEYNHHHHHRLSTQHRSDSAFGPYQGQHYHRTYSHPYSSVDRESFYSTSTGYNNVPVASYGHKPYDVPDPQVYRYRLREPSPCTPPLPPVSPTLPGREYNEFVPYRRSHSLPPPPPLTPTVLSQHPTYCTERHRTSSVDNNFPMDQSLPKQHVLMDHNIESQYHSPCANRPRKHDHLPISDTNNRSDRIHIYHTAGSPEICYPQRSSASNNSASTSALTQSTEKTSGPTEW